MGAARSHPPTGPPATRQYATFHPTFLYELIWNLALAAFLVWLGHHRRIRPPGLFALYVAGYSAFRIFEESLRVDPAHHILGLRLNFFVACALTVAGPSGSWRLPRREETSGGGVREGRALLAIGWAALALIGCGQGPGRRAGSPPANPGHTVLRQR